MSVSKRNILVTSALPYANGPIHLGHLLEYIQTDIWARFHKQLPNTNCYFVCADDAHGTGISLWADQLKKTPEQLIQETNKQRQHLFAKFNVSFDEYHSTHSEENKQLVYKIYEKVKQTGTIINKKITQAYDEKVGQFLADRYIKGTCPICYAEDQYGDNCEKCGATYNAYDLKNPYSILSGEAPILKETEHLFFKLSHYEKVLQEWIHSGSVEPEVANKLMEWFKVGLKDWDITRDAPYFGFNIPGTENKFFYVWLDAPVGYLSSFAKFCSKHPQVDFESFINKTSSCELHHFIGKDIINFHCLFWPALLYASDFRMPSKVHVHGYLTLNGQKMSKSRGTFITAEHYQASDMDSDFLRYYFATKLSPKVDDIDFNGQDFVQRINTDLVGKVVNIASRCAKFINTYFDNQLTDTFKHNDPLLERVQQQAKPIEQFYAQNEIGKAMRLIMSLADEINAWIDQKKPWVIAKEDKQSPLLHQISSLGLNLYKIIMTYLKPVTVNLAQKTEDFLLIEPLDWLSAQQLLGCHKIKTFKPLMGRVKEEQVEKLFKMAQQQTVTNAFKENTIQPGNQTDQQCFENPPIASPISFEDFAKIDLRIARIIDAKPVAQATKLLELTVDLGHNQKTIFAGIKTAYAPESLIGQLTVVVANLKPRKMRFGLSEGMVLAAGPGGESIWLLQPHDGAQPGMRVM